MQIKKIGIISFLSLSFASQAAVKTIDHLNLNTVHSLSIQSGIYSHVVCTQSNKNKIVATGSPQKLRDLSYQVRDHNLIIDGGTKNSFFNFNGNLDKAVHLTLHLSQPIQRITMKYGVKLNMDACAVTSDSLVASLSSGTALNLSGQTDAINLYVGEGSSFNLESSSFKVRSADVHCTSGCRINLTGADKVSGVAKFGGFVQISRNTIHHLHTTMGGVISY